MDLAAAGMDPEHITLTTADGLDLRGWHWPVEGSRGDLIVVHGLGEHGRRYGHVARALGPAVGLDVLAFDSRGHGLSPGRRGVVKSYHELVWDLHAAFDWIERRGLDRPRFVLGHSNGGQVALEAALLGGVIDGLVLSNPMIRLAISPRPWQLAAGRILRRVAPGVTLKTNIRRDQLCREFDPAIDPRLDPLRHDRVCADLFFGMVEGGERLLDRARHLTIPVLMVLGGADTVTDPTASRTLFERLGSLDKTILEIPDGFHEPLNDIGRAETLGEIAQWLAHLTARS